MNRSLAITTRAIMLSLIFLCAYGFPNSTQAAEGTYVIEKQEVAFSYQLRGVVKPTDLTPLQNPVSWKPVRHVVPDGSFVKKDDIIAEFDPLYQDKKYEKMLIQKHVVNLELEEKLNNIEDRIQTVQDQIKERSERLKVLNAKLARLKSLPLKSDVIIAKGQLRVAELELKAAQVDWKNAQERHAKGYLSDTELKRYEFDLKRKSAHANHKKQLLEVADTGAPDWDVKPVELQIESVQLELKKLNFEQKKQADFIEISKTGARRNSVNFDRRLKRSKEEVEGLTVKSPRDGYVVYTDDFKRALDENGGKMWRRRVFVNIPHIETMYIDAMLPEHMRQLIEVGNVCDIYIPGASAKHIIGNVDHIENRPQDITSIDGNVHWGSEDKDSGIKVYKMKISYEDSVSKMKPYSNVDVTLHGKTKERPAVPSQYVVNKDGEHFISIEGVYTSVEGYAVNGWFMLSDDRLLGKNISLHGSFPLQSSDENVKADDQGQLLIQGEVAAASERYVSVGRIYRRSSKIVELVEDGAEVKAGDLLITLDDTETIEELQKREEEHKNKVSEREKAEEQLKVVISNGEIDLKLAKYSVEIAAWALKKQKENINKKSVADYKLRHELAKLDHLEAQSDWYRKKALPEDRISKTELRQSERDYKRKSLQLEKAAIQEYLVLHGVDYYALRNAEKVYEEKRLNYEGQEKRLQYNIEVERGLLFRSKRWESDALRRLDDIKRAQENLKIYAPADGTAQYKIIWDGDLTKIKKGSSLRHRFKPISIADFSKSMVELEVPEEAFTYIALNDEVVVQIPSLGSKEFKGRVEEIDFIFKNKNRKDVSIGVYGNREPLGQSVFNVKVVLDVQDVGLVKPGMQAWVRFPVEWPIPVVGANYE